MSQPVVESCLSNGQGILDLCVQPFIKYGTSDIFCKKLYNFKHGNFFLNFWSLKNVAKIRIRFPTDFSHIWGYFILILVITGKFSF